MRFGTWSLMSSYRAGSLMTVLRELSKYKLVEVQWEGGGSEPTGEYIFFGRKGSENHELGIGFFVQKKIMSAVRRVEFISDRMPYIILRGYWFRMSVLNIHAPKEDKMSNVKDNFYDELEHIFNEFPKYYENVLRRFQWKVDKEDIFKSTNGNIILCEISNDNGIRVVNYTTSKNLIVKSTMFPHCYNHKYTWTSSDRGRHLSILDVQPFRTADCDPHHCLVVAEIKETSSE
jgi:hypothetical protein